MPETQRKKDNFTLAKGLNTVSNEISFPDGFTSDELNYTIGTDGSRRRRKGLDAETGASTKTVVAIATGQSNQSFKWNSAGGDPTKNLLVHQVGYTLYISDDAETISTTYNADSIDLSNPNFLVDSGTAAATVGGEPCSFAVHRGYLVVTNKYLQQFYITYDPATDAISTTDIQILFRDFEGIEDGKGIKAEPTAETDDHKYNLHNRGWKTGDYDSFFSTLAKYPSKNSLWYKGYKRTYAANIYEQDGVRSWDDTKMDAEVFGSSSAPQGALFLDPLDTTVAISAAEGGVETGISSWSYADETTAESLTVTFDDNHGWATPADDGTDINISGQSGTYNKTGSGIDFTFTGLRGTRTLQSGTPTGFGEAQVTGVASIAIWVAAVDANFDVWASKFFIKGQLDGGPIMSKSDGKALTVGPRVCEAFAGRMWYGGIDDNEFSDTIFYSQVALKATSFGLCHQKLDPTDEQFNSLQADDGGHLVIPGLGTLQQMLATRSGMLLFSSNGVWEVTGGRGGFSALDVNVRKLTNAECDAPLSVVQFDAMIAYSGPKGITVLAPNQFTGILEGTSLTEDTVQTTWNAITTANRQLVQAAYDDALKRVYFLYRESATLSHTYDKALVLDIRNGGFYRLGFNYGAAAGIISVVAITDSDSAADNKKVKFQCEATTTTVKSCDMEQTDYIDFDGSESPLPYLVTGWDPLGDFQRKGQAPIVTVFNKRTGTGWTSGGGGWTEDNQGSTLMTPYWDWTEATQWDDPAAPTAQEAWDASTNNFGVSGKIGKQEQTYRHIRIFVPLATGDVSGLPILSTRHKIRGRGRVLSMRFDGEATFDSHLLGFTTNQKTSRNK